MNLKVIGIFAIIIMIANIIPTIGAINEKYNYRDLEIVYTVDDPGDLLEGADQYQIDVSDNGFPLTTEYNARQEFKPSKRKLSAAAIHLDGLGNKDITLKITGGSVSTSKTVHVTNQMLAESKWVYFDFENITVTPHETYEIFCSSDAVDYHYALRWTFANGNPYDRGIAYVKWNTGIWYNLEEPKFNIGNNQSDFCFITYGSGESIDISTNNYNQLFYNIFQIFQGKYPYLFSILKKILD